jgi:hypothetical protein
MRGVHLNSVVNKVINQLERKKHSDEKALQLNNPIYPLQKHFKKKW